MIGYIKMLIMALVCGVMAPLPVSSAAHCSFINSVTKFTADEGALGFYYAVFCLAFSFVIFINLRKIYIKTFKSAFKSSKNGEASVKAYKKVSVNILISLLPLLLLYIPVPEGEKSIPLIDFFEKFLYSSGLLLSAFVMIISAFITVIAIWYTKHKKEDLKRNANRKTVLRTAIYNLSSFVVPGMSKVGIGSVNMLICDVEPKVIMREIYLYLAPQMFLLSLIKVIRCLVADVVIDPLLVIIGFGVCAIASAVIVRFVSKVNMRKLLGFFAAYTAVFGIYIAVMFFLI